MDNIFKTIFKTKFRHIWIFIVLVVGSFVVYKAIYPHPRNWYDHLLHLTYSFLDGRVDVPTLPQFYHDTVDIAGKRYLPFPPGPSLILIPFVLISRAVTQQEVSVILGALNVGLVYVLAKKFTQKKEALVIALFFAFGSVAFWSTIVGTTWYFAQNSAFLFLTLALLLHYNKKDFFAGLALAIAVSCRYPMLFGSIFFGLALLRDRKRLINFLLGFAPVFPIQAIYSYARFGSFFETGYYKVYEWYAHGGIPQTVLQLIDHNFPVFGYMDVRNIPLHLFTFLVMPPLVSLHPFSITPSPYGTGILFTSPLLFIAFKNVFKDNQRRLLLLGAGAIALIDFLHYMQGWVQFGYRFVLDFMPFLIILLALNLKLKRLTFILLTISIIVCTWGVVMGIKLGW